MRKCARNYWVAPIALLIRLPVGLVLLTFIKFGQWIDEAILPFWESLIPGVDLQWWKEERQNIKRRFARLIK